MSLVTTKKMFENALNSDYAVGAFNVNNMEIIQGITEAAIEERAPLILQVSSGARKYAKHVYLMKLIEAALLDAQYSGVDLPICVHLDHGDSAELAAQCLDAGFDSVMIDGSERPLEENIALTQRVVEMARPYGANVEAELGYVAKLGQTQGGGFTTPEDAARFVAATGVDALAVAVGSAHGFYKQPPKLDIERLKAIHAATDVVLVLHGSSGIPHPMVQEAIANGIAKVNLATEIKDTFMRIRTRSTCARSFPRRWPRWSRCS